MRGEIPRPEDASFGDDAGNQGRWGDVESRIQHRHARRSDGMTAMDCRHFERVPCLNGNVGPRLRLEVDGGVRRSHVEGDVVRPRKDSHRIRADLVGHVAVGGNAIGADDAELNLSLAHEGTGHVIRDECDRNLILHQFPCREARPLQHGPGFIGYHLDPLPLLPRCPDHAQGGSIPSRRQGPGVAVRQDRLATLD